MSEESKLPTPPAGQIPGSYPRRLRWLLLVLLALVILLGLTLWKKYMQPASTLIQRGNEAFENRDYLAAWRLARRVLDRHPESGDANVLAGRSLAAVSEFAQALEYFDRVPDDASLAAVQARCDAALVLLLHYKLLTKSEQQLRRALQQDPRQLRANDHLAFVLGLSSRNWELIPYRLTLIELDHIDPMHLYLLCLGESAIENDHLVNEYHQRGPTDAGPLVALSRLAYESQDYQAAEHLARTAIALNRELIEGHVKLGRVLLQVGTDDALDDWHKNLPSAADDHPGIWAIRGAWAQRQALKRVAIRCYWETVRRDANHQGANYQLGQRLAAMGRTEEAEPLLERARLLQEYLNIVKVAIGSNKAEDLRASARAAKRLGLNRESYAWYQLSLKEDPQASDVEQESQRLRAEFSSMEIPQTRNLADNNPALNIDLSDFPLPQAGIRGTRPLDTPQAAATAFPTFENQASKANLIFQYFNAGEPNKDIKRMYEFTGGGSAVLDYDRDGWPDLCLTQGSRWPPDVDQEEHLDQLFRNLGTGSFENVTEHAWLDENGFSQGVTVGDFDNDGFSDVYVANIGANRLFHNNGDGTFSDVTESAGVAGDSWTSSCALCDLNGDALPDLFAVNYLGGEDVFTIESLDDVSGGGVFMPQYFPAAQDRLYLNLGDGTFADVTSISGIEVADGKGLGLVAADFDLNGRIEMFVANDSVSNFFFRSEHKTGEALGFVEDGPISGLAMNARGAAEACMGTAVGDVDANGRLDLFVTNFYQESNTLYLQDDHGRFADGTLAAGLRDASIFALGFGTQFVDAELDGLPDLIVSNGHISNFRSLGSPYRMPPQYFRNDGNGRFLELVGSALGEYFEGAYLGRSMAVLDWNKDGREDVVIGHLDAPLALLTNTTQSAGNYLAVNLCGTESARDAIGTILRLTVDGRTRTQQLTAGGGYHARNEPRLVFGLGDLELVESLVVRWPSGNQQTFSDVPTNAELIVVENRSVPIIMSTP